MRTLARRILARPIALIAASIVALFATSCGDSSGGESVFLYVIHGYAGAETMTLIGPGGPIVSELGFGDRADGPFPIEVDRTLGSDFTLVLDGTPQAIDFQKELLALYPQETATLFITRRSGVAQAEVTLFRHVQSITRACLLTMHNSLSLDNQFSTTEFTFYPEFNLGSAAAGGYFDESIEQVFTECGPIETPNPAPVPRSERDASGNIVPLHQAIDSYPWFFPVPCTEAVTDAALCWHWGSIPPAGPPTILFDGGTVIGPSNSRTYLECVEGAVTIKQPEDPANPLPFPPADAQVQCPDGPITWDDVNVDGAAIRECKEGKQAQANGIAPGQEDTYYTQVRFPGPGATSCNYTLRMRTALLDVIFGPNDGESLGRHGVGNGSLIESNIEIPLASEHFYVVFGRPVNALLWQWNSGETFANLEPFPYPNAQNERIGDYDDSPGN